MQRKDLLLGFLCIILWGMTYPLTKIVVLHMPPLWSTTIRLFCFSFIFIPFVGVPKKEWGKITALAFSLYAVPYATTYYGIKEVEASIAAITTELEVPIGMILSYFIFKEPLYLKHILGMIVSFLGIYVLSGSPEFQGHMSALGLLLISAFSYGCSALQIKMIKNPSSFCITVWANILAGFMLLIASLGFETNHIESLLQAPSAAWISLFSAGCLTTISFVIWTELFKKYPVNQILTLALLIPVTSIFWGYVILGEVLEEQELIGALLTIGGVAILYLGSNKEVFKH